MAKGPTLAQISKALDLSLIAGGEFRRLVLFAHAQGRLSAILRGAGILHLYQPVRGNESPRAKSQIQARSRATSRRGNLSRHSQRRSSVREET